MSIDIAGEINKILSPGQMGIVKKAAKDYGVDENLILAIGWHETGWGTLGDGTKGMYTGYGSFDSGSDYGYAGFEKQVRGTAWKLGQWGQLGPGEVTLNRLMLGNSGVLPSKIYATDQNWPNAIWRIYSEIVGGKPVMGTGSEKTSAEIIDGFRGAGSSAAWVSKKDYGKSVGYGLLFVIASIAIGGAIIVGGSK